MNNNIPDFLYEMLVKQYGEELTKRILEGYKAPRYVTFRVNTLKSNVQKISMILNENGIEYEKVEWYEDAFIIKNAKEQDIRNLKIYDDGEIYLQSLSSMIPPLVLNPSTNENILDMAAAPGGKTTQMSALSQNQAMITACEKNKIRLDRLKYNIDKQSAKSINVMQQDSRELSDYFKFDKILLDAPCSGSGTLHIIENQPLKNFDLDLIKRSKKFQEQLLKKALNILKKDGELVYSTCSILNFENEKIINKILNTYNIQIIPIDEDKFKNIPKLPTTIKGALCVKPTKLYEGFFVVKLKKI